MSIRVLLSDDETLARERLRSLLEEETDLDIVAECGDGKSAIATIQREQPDLVFLDIQMPEVDGFGVVQELRDAMPLTIFVTAYDRYAMKAFEVHALDYLLKPVGKERLTGAVDRARRQLQHPPDGTFQRRVLELLGDMEARQQAPERIVIKSDGRSSASDRTRSTGQSQPETTCACTSGRNHILRGPLLHLSPGGSTAVHAGASLHSG